MRKKIKQNRVMSEINITPLTDVMMVLLVIFMVTTPLIMKASIDINYPKARAKKAAQTQTLQIMLTKQGILYFNNKQIHFSKLESFLSRYFKKNLDKSVTVAADEEVPYGEVVKILDSARQAGATKLILAAEPLPVKSLSAEILKK